MSLYGALFAGVTGLKAQANKIGVISDNIANVNTVGYKSTEAQFETLVVNSGVTSAYSPGGVLANNRLNIDRQGLLIPTDAPTDIALSGDGFFVVNAATDGSDTPLYTRAGSFRKDETGNFVNAGGYYLQGWRLDGNGDIPITSANLDSLSTVNIESATGVASPTTAVSLGANLDASEAVFPGEGLTIGMDSLSTANFGIQADDIIVPAEFSLSTTNSITRLDQFTTTTGNGLEFSYQYGGFSIGRSVTTAGATNVGDGQTDVTADITLAGGELATVGAAQPLIEITLANHGLVTGDTITLAGITPDPLDGIPAAEINTTHVVTRTGANTFTIQTTTNATAGSVNNLATGTMNIRQFSGNIFDATTVNETFLRNSNVAEFTTAARQLTITTPSVGTVSFTYTSSSPSIASGEFNTVANLAAAIDEVAGLTARVQGGRLIVGAEDANEAVTFANGDGTGTSTLKGLDWVTELDLVNVASSTRRFSTLQGLADLVNADDGVTAVVSNPLSNTTIDFRVDDPLDTIQFDDYVQNPATRLGNDAFSSAGGGVGADVVVTVTDASHGLSVGQSVTISGATAFGGFTVGELNATHTVASVIDANTYTVVINNAAGGGAVAGGGNAIDRQLINNGSLLAELGLVTSLNGAAYTAQTTGALGPRYDTSGAIGENIASGDIEAQFSRSIRVYDSLGAPHDLQMGVIKIAQNTWAIEVYAVPESDVDTTLSDGQIVTGTISFNGDGSLRSVSSDLVNPVNINWTNGSVSSEITFDWGTAGQPSGTANATAIGDTDGFSQFTSDYNVAFVNQNGSQVGQLIGVSIDEDGIVTASFSNGETQDLYKIPVADFSNPNGLNPQSGNVFGQTRQSGEVNLREAGDNGTGSVVSSALESSNVELSNQLTDLIVAQRAYQSNTQAISATDELLEELNRL